MKKTLLIISLILASLGIVSCNNTSSNIFDEEYDISLKEDNSLKCKIKKSEDKYSVEIKGTGLMRDFDDKKAPWSLFSQRIIRVDIDNGVQNIGKNAFNKVAINYYILPSSLTYLNDEAFIKGQKLYSYSETLFNSEHYDVYYYSETMPSLKEGGKSYFYIDSDGKPVEWVVKEKKALFIGNSFTFYSDIPGLVKNIANSAGYPLKTESITKGSHTLEKFSLSSDEMGAKVHEALNTSSDYDYVILQEQSTRSYENTASFKKGVSTINELVKVTQTKCDVRLYETWGFQSEADALNLSIPKMEEKICEAYESVASEIGLKIHYVGKAFSKTYLEQPTINLYHSDNKHPSYVGAYLSALVHFGYLYPQANLNDITYYGDDPSLTKETAIILRDIAKYIVSNNK